jgi:hypothetical protein
LESIANFTRYLNPFDSEWFGYKIISGIAEFFIGDGTDENIGVLGFLKNIIEGIGKIVSFILNFFENLLQLFVNIFVPTDDQWQTIQDKYSLLGDLVTSHLPFVATFQDALEQANNNVISNSDMLVITMPSFSFFGVTTEEQKVINVQQAYEPYRQQIRTFLTYIVYSMGIVYIIKYIVGWGQTQANTEVKESSQYMSWAKRK